MKKIIRLFLVLTLTAAMFCGLFVTAFAEDDEPEDPIAGYMIPYTVKGGDTLYSICAAKGVSYGSNEKLILAFSGISDARYLYVGKTVWLPVSDKGDCEYYYTLYSHEVLRGETWYGICKALGANYTASSQQIKALNGAAADNLMAGVKVTVPVVTGAPAASTVVPSTGSSSAGSSATGTETKPAAVKVDTSYKYLIPVVMKSGDTVAKLCAKYKVDFDVYSAIIAKLSGISSYNAIPVGKQIYLPGNTAPEEGNFYKVVEYKVVSGDTLIKVCKANGFEYSAVAGLLKLMNPSVTGSGMIYVGQKLLLPVPVTSADVKDDEKAEEKSDSKEEKSDGKSDEIVVSSIMILESEDGEIYSMVGGKKNTTAKAGVEVYLSITPEAGKTVSKISVIGNDTKKEYTVKDNRFTMPKEAVTVQVLFK